jgi:hypothetical protein
VLVVEQPAHPLLIPLPVHRQVFPQQRLLLRLPRGVTHAMIVGVVFAAEEVAVVARE